MAKKSVAKVGKKKTKPKAVKKKSATSKKSAAPPKSAARKKAAVAKKTLSKPKPKIVANSIVQIVRDDDPKFVGCGAFVDSCDKKSVNVWISQGDTHVQRSYSLSQVKPITPKATRRVKSS